MGEEVVFETEEDKRRQQSVADQLAHLWRCEIVKRAPLSPVDWSATRDGKLVAVLELKCRTTPRTYYPTLWISAAKRDALLAEAKEFDVPGVFVVQFTDALCYVKATDIHGEEIMAGRNPRPGSVKDIELMVDLPIERLRVAAVERKPAYEAA